MDIKFSSEGLKLYAEFSGEFDHHSAKTAREKTDMMLKLGVYNCLILDFKGLNFMDSSGISFIMGRMKILSSLGGRVIVKVSDEKISRIIKLAGLTEYVELEEGGRN